MNDTERFKQLVVGGDCCISIVTYEERCVLETIRQAALDLKQGLWIWSVAGGVKEGFLADSPYIADTETPTSGLRYLAETEQPSICVVLDLAEHKLAMLFRSHDLPCDRKLREQSESTHDTDRFRFDLTEPAEPPGAGPCLPPELSSDP